MLRYLLEECGWVARHVGKPRLHECDVAVFGCDSVDGFTTRCKGDGALHCRTQIFGQNVPVQPFRYPEDDGQELTPVGVVITPLCGARSTIGIAAAGFGLLGVGLERARPTRIDLARVLVLQHLAQGTLGANRVAVLQVQECSEGRFANQVESVQLHHASVVVP